MFERITHFLLSDYAEQVIKVLVITLNSILLIYIHQISVNRS